MQGLSEVSRFHAAMAKEEEEEEEEVEMRELNGMRRSAERSGEETRMAAAVPRELIELRRQLNLLTSQRQEQLDRAADRSPSASDRASELGAAAQLSLGEWLAASSGASAATSNAPLPAEDNSEFRRLSQSKTELSERLRDLQSKKGHLDSLLGQLQSLRDMRALQEAEGEPEEAAPRRPKAREGSERNGAEARFNGGSASSSMQQLDSAREIGMAAGNTAAEAEETMRLLDAQKKLLKLKQVSTAGIRTRDLSRHARPP